MKIESDFPWATIVLAAGASARMGHPKQLIEVEGMSLIQRIVGASLDAGALKTIVVTGANRLVVEENLKGLHVTCEFNPDWDKGMGSSLKSGVRYLINHVDNVSAALLLVCDQPFVNPGHLKKLVREFHTTRSPIVASWYSDQNGVPALFHRSLFNDLLAIDDQHGAKKIIAQNPALVKSIDFPQGSIDLDTQDDLKKFMDAGC